MRRIVLHRRATKYFRRMPTNRKGQMIAALEEVAGLDDVSTHSAMRSLTGEDGWFRLRVGVYRAVLQPREQEKEEILYVDYIGPRGDAYRR